MAQTELGEESISPALLSLRTRNYGSKNLNHPELYFSLFHCSCCFSFRFHPFPLATVLCPPTGVDCEVHNEKLCAAAALLTLNFTTLLIVSFSFSFSGRTIKMQIFCL